MSIPNYDIGILGGGQLGRMLILSGARWGLRFKVLDPDPNAPSAPIANHFQCGSLQNTNTILEFAKDCQILTIEIENIETKGLVGAKKANARSAVDSARLSHDSKTQKVALYPDAEHIAITQDKGHQKAWLQSQGLPTAAYYLIEDKAALQNHAHFYPCVQKLRRDGYDGRGVQVLTSIEDAQKKGFTAPSLIEEKVNIDKELAIMVARNTKGNIALASPVEMVFHPTAHILDYLIYPADIAPNVLHEVLSLARSLADQLNVIGLVAIELFLTTNGRLLVNEFALRPHNSGHHTIEAAPCSQYEQLLRILMNFPLGHSACNVPAAACMNLLGHPEVKANKKPDYDLFKTQALGNSNIFMHLYGKELVKPFRKMGHLTKTGESRIEVEKAIKGLLAYRWVN